MALLPELVLTTVGMTYQADFSANYYNLYKIFASLHGSLTTEVLNAFQVTLTDVKNILIVLLVVAVVATPILLLVIGMNIM